MLEKNKLDVQSVKFAQQGPRESTAFSNHLQDSAVDSKNILLSNDSQFIRRSYIGTFVSMGTCKKGDDCNEYIKALFVKHVRHTGS